MDDNLLKVIDICAGFRDQFDIILEVTEQDYLNHSDSIECLKTLRDEGFQISIDDFGTGYSNLNQIASMECNAIKIDRSFVADMETGSIKSSIIPHVVGMAEALKLRVVAEGVENEAQAKKLEEMQVEYGQGWLFGRPMTAMNFSRHLETVSTYQKSKKSALKPVL